MPLPVTFIFWHAGISSECLGQVRLSRSSSQGQGHRSNIVSVYAVRRWHAFDWKAVSFWQLL